MRFNNIVALLAASQTVAAQAVRSRPNGGSNTMVVAPLEPVGEEPPPSTTTTPQAVIALAPIPMSSTAQRQGGQSTPNGRSATRMGSMVATRRPTARLTTTTTSTRGQVGIETVSIVSSGTRSQGKKRQNAPAPVVATVAICPIYAARVPGAPCYPCAVGQPNAQQTLGVVTTSVLGRTPDPTPVFFYSLCRGCRPSLVTAPVPGYTSGSRNFASCLLSPANPTPTPARTSRPASSTSRPSRTTTRTSTRRTSTTAPPTTSFIPGYTTTTLVTATIINLIEVVSICSTNGAIVTVIQQSATCTSYQTCVTIPASLCNTFVSTKPNGAVTTRTTPVDTWTAILTTAVTSTVQTITATATATVVSAAAPIVPTGYKPVSTVSPGSVPAKPSTHVQSGAGRLAASLAAILTTLLTLIF